ncbi:flagellin [Crassaminicella indica]|uniref:Flagellin n=1 Tax=Crassaminicella indica TaxID=2855394 RepID=A0ABX8R8P6_9CLOT|nr:flagellin [Crassaminicella indica]QXM05171.1 flagellin [Crassaminicella indica]
MRINHNLMAMNTHRQLGVNNLAGAKSIEKLSSGYRINRAGDDAAGLAISEKMRGQIRGLNQASRNAQDSISLIQTAEGALQETQAILQRMRELAVQSANDTNVSVDRDKIQSEVDQLSREITRIAETTEFNTQKLLNGDKQSASAAITFHIGANADQNVDLTINNMDAKALRVTKATLTETTISGDLKATNVTTNSVTIKITTGTAAASVSVAGSASAGYTINVTATTGTTVNALKTTLEGNSTIASLLNFADGTTAAITATTAGVTVTAADYSDADSKSGSGIQVNTQSAANTAITTINNAINTVSKERAKLGAMQNRLEHTIKNLDTASENLQASESRIRDVDMAKEMMEFQKNNILQQAAQAMLAQANQAPQGVLQLLR